ncbi:MAG: hypothetical protein ACXV3D_07925 [Halobacteriota archaeon]
MHITLVAGIYEMNFSTQASPWNMPELATSWGYPFALGQMGLEALILRFTSEKKAGWRKNKIIRYPVETSQTRKLGPTPAGSRSSTSLPFPALLRYKAALIA